MAEQVQATVRVINKHGTIAEWNGDNSIILMKGEIGLAEVTSAATGSTDNGEFNPPQYLAKVGDGSTPFKNLKWLAAPASDVYAWAKKAALAVSDLPTLSNSAEDKAKIAAAVNALLADAGVASDDVVTDLANRLNFLEESGVFGSNAIEVTETDVLGGEDGQTKVGTATNITLKLDNSAASEGKTKVELTQTPNGLKAEVVVPDAPVQNVSGDGKVTSVVADEAGDYKVSATLGLKYVAPTETTNAKLVLTGIDGSDVAEMDASAFIVDGMIENAELEAGIGEDEGKTFLKLTFNTAAGKEAVKVDVTTLIDVYEAGNGIDITGKTVSIKLASGSEGFLTVDASGIKLTGVQDAINDAKSEVIGDTDTDTKDSDTVVGAKKYTDAAITDLGLGTASKKNVEDFATAAQGAKADTAVQDIDIDVDTGLTSERDAATNVITIKRNPDVVFILDGGTATSDTSVTA